MNRFQRFLYGISPALHDLVLRENVALQNQRDEKEKIILQQKSFIIDLEKKIAEYKDLSQYHVSVELCREILGQKDYTYVREKRKKVLPDDQMKSYLSQAATLLRSNLLRDIIMEIQYDTMEDIATKADNNVVLLFNRGTINGADLIEQRVKNAYSEYVRLTGDDSAKGFEQYDPVGKITY